MSEQRSNILKDAGVGGKQAAPAAATSFGGFGAAAAAPAAGGFGFGAAPAATGAFGAPAAPAFGGGAFGQPAAAAPAFGAAAAPAFGGFGAPAATTGGFGVGAAAAPAFGAPAGGLGFGAAKPAAFGAAAPAFGAAAPAFGAAAPAFGGFGAAAAPKPFGAAAAPAFGAAGGFGAPAANPFGAPAAGGAFGAAAPAGAFGAPAGGAFGAPAANPFGAPAAGGFGAAAGAFGAPAGGAFGAAPKAFGALGAAPGAQPAAFGAAAGGFGAAANPFGAQQQAALMQPPMAQVPMQVANKMWMADVQTNPYGNLKLRPNSEANAPTMFSSDPNVRTSSLSSGDRGTLSGFPASLASPRVRSGGTFRARAASSLRATPLRRPAGTLGGNASLNSSGGGTSMSQSLFRQSAQASPSYNSASTPNLKANTSRWLELLTDTEAERTPSKQLAFLSPSLPTAPGSASEREKENADAQAHAHAPHAHTPHAHAHAPGAPGGEERGADRPAHVPASGAKAAQGGEQARWEEDNGGGGMGGGMGAGGMRQSDGMGGGGGHGGSEPWRTVIDEYEFLADREPEGLTIPAGMEVRRSWAGVDEGVVSVTFLDALDLSSVVRSAADGRGAEAVARVVHRFLKITGPWEVELTELRARVCVAMRSARLDEVLSNARNLRNMQDNFRRALEEDGWSMDHFAWTANPAGQNELVMEWAPLRA